MKRAEIEKHIHCPMQKTLSVIGGKWKLLIIWYLSEKTQRYNELQKLIGDITPKMLTQQLRELEKDGVVLRTVYPVVPPKVEYSLTEYGLTLLPVMKLLHEWGVGLMEEPKNSQASQFLS